MAQNTRIMVVDDEPDIREMLAESFAMFGYQVLTAESGAQALAQLKLQHDIQVILSDVRMPDGDGIFLLKKVREIDHSNPKFFFVSGFNDHSIDQLYALGADGFLQKPYSASDMREVIQRAIAPRETLWAKTVSTVSDTPIFNYDFESLKVAHLSSDLSFGRGGIFLNLPEDFPDWPLTDQLVRVHIKLHREAKLRGLEILGRVRWIRKKTLPTAPTGIGIEIRNIESSGIAAFVEWLRSQDFLSLIPMS